MDGSQKLPLRLLPTVRERLAAGGRPAWAALAVAGWMAYVARGRDVRDRRLPLDDPMAARLHEVVAGRTDAAAVVDGLLGIEEIFGPDLRECATFRADLIAHLEGLL
jgi:fructuronate reductase